MLKRRRHVRVSSAGIALVSIAVAALFIGLPVLGSSFNEYGYNYGARVFNGWYGYWGAAHDDPPSPPSDTWDAWLSMKWSKNWIPQADEPVGAWCTNHWTWYSDDYDPSSMYGFETRTPWSNDIQPTGDYMVTEFLKIQKVSDDGGMWLSYQAGGAYDATWGTYANWWVLGDWVISVYNTWYHDISITVQEYDTATGSFSGTGTIQVSPDTTLYETVVGSVIGTTVSMTLKYYLDAEHTVPVPDNYQATLTGTIDANDGSISGTFEGGPWESTSGHAFHVPCYVVYQDVIDVFNAGSGKVVAHFDLCTTAPHGLGQPLF